MVFDVFFSLKMYKTLCLLEVWGSLSILAWQDGKTLDLIFDLRLLDLNLSIKRLHFQKISQVFRWQKPVVLSHSMWQVPVTTSSVTPGCHVPVHRLATTPASTPWPETSHSPSQGWLASRQHYEHTLVHPDPPFNTFPGLTHHSLCILAKLTRITFIHC